MLKPNILDPKVIFDACHCLYSIDAIEKGLTKLYSEPELVIDIETTGSRPYSPNAKILSIAVGTSDYTISFPWLHPGHKWTPTDFERLRKIWHVFIRNKKQKKKAHNDSFEIEWFVHEFDDLAIAVSNWSDTMSAAYLLNFGGGSKGQTAEGQSERVYRGLLSLDNLSRIYLGFWLKAQSKVDRVNLERAPLAEVLRYGAGDACATHYVSKKLDQDVKYEGLQSIVNEHDRRVPAFVLAQYKGLYCDIERAKAHSNEFAQRITSAFTNVNNHSSVIEYRSKFSKFDVGAPADIANFFRSLGYNVFKKDKEGKDHLSSDDEILKAIDHPVANWVLEYREFVKLKATYCDPFIPGTKGCVVYPDGRIHTSFTTTFTTTGRTSSSDPNIQNMPKRQHKEIRDIIVAPEGHVLTSADFGQIEYRCIVMTCKDQKLIDYVWANRDIHAEWALKIAKRYPKRVGAAIVEKWASIDPHKLKDQDKLFKQWRDVVKNAFVFASLYGAGVRKVAAGLGIPEAVARELQGEFWEEFAGAKKWQEDCYKFYSKHGYIESLTGARRYGPLQSGEIINTPIQRLACDIVIDSMNRLVDYAFETGKMQFIPVYNVHDDLGHNLPENSWKDDLNIIIDIMLGCRYSFIVVPLSVEASYGPNWAIQHTYGEFNNAESLKERLQCNLN